MLRGVTETGSVFVGLVPGELVDRLRAGEDVLIPGHTDAAGLVHRGFWLNARGGGRMLQRLFSGQRICVPAVVDEAGIETFPHVCIFYRETNAELMAAANELFPGGLMPGAKVELARPTEPTGDQ